MDTSIHNIPSFFDWNIDSHPSVPPILPIPRPTLAQLDRVEFDDESTRDGLQGTPVLPSAPKLETYLEHTYALGIKTVTVGVYSEEKSRADRITKQLLKFMATHLKEMVPIVLARAMPVDMEYAKHCAVINPKLEVMIFQASSPIRMWVAGWTEESVLSNLSNSLAWAVKEKLHPLIATEDTTRSTPEFIRKFLDVAIHGGAERVVIADTVGHLDSWGCYRIITFIRSYLDSHGTVGENIGIDFHGHRDRGMDGEVAMAAISAGATRIHGVMMGVGERSGNAILETLIYNVERMRFELGAKNERWDVSLIPEICHYYSSITKVDIPTHYPLAGGNTFTTAVGIHADAQEKALIMLRSMKKMKNVITAEQVEKIEHLLRTIYTSADHRALGRPLSYLIGPMSGESTVRMWLYEQGYNVVLGKSTAAIRKIKQFAKQQKQILTDDEITQLLSFLKIKRKSIPQPSRKHHLVKRP